MNISITPELEKFVQSLVKSGMYNSASEVMRDALRLLEEKQELRKKRIEHLNAEIQKGLDDIKAGRVVSAEEVMRDMQIFKTQFKSSHD
jgi:antitoxin ParD1/3/4